MADESNSFLADIDEKTLKELDLRLALATAQPNQPKNQARQIIGHALPSLDPDAAARSADLSRASAAPPDTLLANSKEDGAMNFMAELEQEVAALKQGGALPAQDAQNKAQQLHEALSRIFTFFNQMSRHTNQLEPEISRVYRLDAQTSYSGLRWRGAFADFRKQDLSENAHLSHASFRVRLVAPEPITLIRRWDQLEALKRDLHILDLRIINDAVLSEKAEQEFVKLQLASDFPVQINFKGNYKTYRINMLCRNLEGFCISAFILDSAHVTQSLLEELGRYLLSRSNVLPGALQRVNHVPPAAKTP